MNTPKDKQSKENECSDTSTCSVELADSPSRAVSLGEYEQLSLWRSIPTLNSSCDRTSQEFQFIPTSETTSPESESLTLSQWDSPVREHQTQELERDSNIQLHLFGEKDLDVLLKLNPASVLSNSLKALSDEDFELFLADSVWQDTQQKLAMSRQQSLERVIKGSDYLSFPTLTSNARGTSRPAGQTKCEKWFKDNGLIESGYQLGTKAIALTMGFPSGWFEGLTEQYSNKATIPSQVKPQAESEPDIWQEEPLHQHKQPLPSAESSISTQLLGGMDKCSSKSSGTSIAPSKEKVSNASIKRSSNNSPPSKSRRTKGKGSGWIECKPIKRSGKEYKQYWYHYEEWQQGDRVIKKSKYISKSKRSQIEKMNNEKAPVAEILKILQNRGKGKKK